MSAGSNVYVPGFVNVSFSDDHDGATKYLPGERMSVMEFGGIVERSMRRHR